MAAQSSNTKLNSWVAQWAKVLQPDDVYWCDGSQSEYDLAVGALDGSIFRMLRQGQRVLFSLDTAGRATTLRLGSERDMETPGA